MAPNNLTLEAAGGAAGALVHSADQMAGSDTLGVERAKPCRIVLLTALLIIISFLCFAVQKIVYLVQLVTSNEKLLAIIANHLQYTSA
jgi:hypothetical protein